MLPKPARERDPEPRDAAAAFDLGQGECFAAANGERLGFFREIERRELTSLVVFELAQAGHGGVRGFEKS